MVPKAYLQYNFSSNIKYDKTNTTIGDNENKICAVELLKYQRHKVKEHTPKKFILVLIKNQNFWFIYKGLTNGTLVICVWNSAKNIIDIERKNKNWIVLKSSG